MSPVLRPMLALALSAALLAGCESDEEKAERYFQSGMELLEQGDVDRALVEFRNVFNYDGFHKEARQTYADIQLQRGRTAEAYSQYLRLVEQYPDTVAARETLADIAIARNDWDEARRHGQEAVRLAPEEPRARAIGAALAYRDAVIDEDDAAADEAVEQARAVLDETPDNQTARRIVIDRLVKSDDPQQAMPQIDAALEVEPEALDFNMMKFHLLVQADDVDGTGDQLKRMFEMFPDNEEVQEALIRWYMVRQDFDGAEAFLRAQAGEDTAATEGHLAVVQLLESARGPDAAAAELDRLAQANQEAGQDANAQLYQSMKALIDFREGRRDQAISRLEGILQAAGASDQTRRIKVMLARMLAATGNAVGARARVEEVLAEDSTNVEALKMRAAWLIRDDAPGTAILDLRAALDQSPRDTEILMLMAEAHQRDGSLELAQERLALAVEVSNAGARESLRYARFLLQQQRPSLAEQVLVDARRTNPDDLDVAGLLGEVLLRNQKWAQAQSLANELRARGGDQAEQLARSLQGAVLLGENRLEDSLDFLQSQVGQGEAGSDSDLAAIVQILRTQVMAGRPAEARDYLDGLIADRGPQPALRLMSANLYALEGRLSEAEDLYRGLIDEAAGDMPQGETAQDGADADTAAAAGLPDQIDETAVRQLHGLLVADGRPDEADAVVDAALQRHPDLPWLRLLDAHGMERTGDIDGAIAAYEAVYEADSDDVVAANNLASLITTYRDSPEDVQRAYTIARRLNGSEVPAFQDTLGWIEFLRGNVEQAVPMLEAAAEGLPEEPTVRIHLGLAYARQGRDDAARTALTRGLELAGDRDLPQLDRARAALAELGGAAPADAGDTVGTEPETGPEADTETGAIGTDAPAGTGTGTGTGTDIDAEVETETEAGNATGSAPSATGADL